MSLVISELFGEICAKFIHSTMQVDWKSDWVSMEYLLCCTFGFVSKPAGVFMRLLTSPKVKLPWYITLTWEMTP